jgi:hypothetical protein
MEAPRVGNPNPKPPFDNGGRVQVPTSPALLAQIPHHLLDGAPKALRLLSGPDIPANQSRVVNSRLWLMNVTPLA